MHYCSWNSSVAFAVKQTYCRIKLTLHVRPIKPNRPFWKAQLNLAKKKKGCSSNTGKVIMTTCGVCFGFEMWNETEGSRERGKICRGRSSECKPEQNIFLPLGGDKTWCTSIMSSLLTVCKQQHSTFSVPLNPPTLLDRFWCQKEVWLLT